MATRQVPSSVSVCWFDYQACERLRQKKIGPLGGGWIFNCCTPIMLLKASLLSRFSRGCWLRLKWTNKRVHRIQPNATIISDSRICWFATDQLSNIISTNDIINIFLAKHVYNDVHWWPTSFMLDSLQVVKMIQIVQCVHEKHWSRFLLNELTFVRSCSFSLLTTRENENNHSSG